MSLALAFNPQAQSMGWNTNNRPVNAEEAVLPIRTVVILVVGLLSLTGAAVTVTHIATGQWDKTQQKLTDLSDDQGRFRAYIADLIVKKGGERDTQNKAITDTIAILTRNMVDLSNKLVVLQNDQSSSHDETVAAVAAIQLQISNIVKDIAIMKCKLPGNDCGKPKL